MLKSWCFSNRKERAKQLLDGVVSSMETVKNCRTVVFWQWGEGEKLLTMVFQQQKRKGETIVGRCCFVNGEM
jgi:hypothetical protein